MKHTVNRQQRTITDEEERLLVTRCIAGDEYAWELMYRRYVPAVRRTIHFVLGFQAAHAEDDVVQDVFLQIVRHLPRFRFEAGLATWLDRITRNQCLKTLSRLITRRRFTVLMGDMKDDGAGLEPSDRWRFRAPSIEEKFVEREHMERLEDAMQKLPAADRDLILARLTGSIPWKEVANGHGMTPGHAAVRLHRAVKTLKKLLR